jgi:DNA-binding response OmpR family regulator
MHRLRVLYVGDRQYCEYVEALAFLDRSFDVAHVDDLAAACRYVREAPIDLVVIASRWPGEHLAADFEALRDAAPFTPIVTLLGPWCEGEVRTGKPWPGAIRLYAHQFITRLTAELADGSLDAGGELFSSWSPPLTKTHEDRLLSDRPVRSLQSVRVGISARSRSAAGALSDVIMGAGITSVPISRDLEVEQHEFDAIVWDCVGGLPDEVPQFTKWRSPAAGVPVVVLLSFPRQRDQELAIEIGAAAIISKPFLVQDLVCALEQITQGSQVVSAGAVANSTGFGQSPHSATSVRTISRLQAGS